MKLTIRKALVNDIVHSFCYCCRKKTAQWPLVIFEGQAFASILPVEFLDTLLVPYIDYALRRNKNYVIAMRQVILLATWLRNLNVAEQDYATNLMVKYYGYRNRETEWDESHFSRHD
jgi:hypothetical protein